MLLNLLNKSKSYAAGTILCLTLAAICKYAAIQFHLPVMLTCLLAAIALSHYFKQDMWKGGVNFTSKAILRLGVILIGARFVFSDLSNLGLPTIALIIASTLALVPLSIWVAKALKLDKNLGVLMGGATAICGASAAMAISALLLQNKENEKNTAAAVIGVTAIGTAAMIGYPFIMPLLPINDSQTALLIGGTIHDVAQVVGAGYSLSPEIGEEAILIKLIRVFMLIPVLLILAAYLHKTHASQGEDKPKFKFPLFLIGFIALVILNGFEVIPDDARSLLKEISHWCLIAAITAVGLKTPIKDILSLNWRPLSLVLINSALLLGFYGLYIAFV